LEALHATEPANIDVTWRFARAHFDVAEPEKDVAKKTALFTNALKLIDAALELPGGEECAAVHKVKWIVVFVLFSLYNIIVV
jgi:hypothetical protein